MYSRPVTEIIQETRRLVENGYREIVLTGIHLGHYGVDTNWNRPKDEWTRLSTLVRELVMLDGSFRIRLSSIEATEVTRELLELMREFRHKVCPHLHVCLQSGSDSVLRRMRRRWGSRRFIDRCQMIKETLDTPALTTDIIVGFPGETDDEFQQTCDVAERVGFSKIHIFPFSPRRGTPAASMPGPVSQHVKAERSRHLARIEEWSRRSYFESLLGRNLDMLVESESVETGNPRWVGTACRYVPVELESQSGVEPGRLVNVVARIVRSDRVIVEKSAEIERQCTR
jgi:threonylcarbamoyladenosine tRNA methylthiotransferase MtaB